MDSLRDWGHAKDYVKMQWMMLQQEQPEDFVIATGVQYSVRQFVEMAAAQLGIKLRFEGSPAGFPLPQDGSNAGQPAQSHHLVSRPVRHGRSQRQRSPSLPRQCLRSAV